MVDFSLVVFLASSCKPSISPATFSTVLVPEWSFWIIFSWELLVKVIEFVTHLLYIILKQRKKLIFMFEHKSPEHYLLVLTFSVSESVLESSVGAVLVLNPAKASLVSSLHVE